MKNTITVRLPDGLSKEIQYIAEKEKIPLSDVVRESLSRYVTAKRFWTARKRVLPFAEKAGIITDEDAFRVFKRK